MTAALLTLSPVLARALDRTAVLRIGILTATAGGALITMPLAAIGRLMNRR